jgi:prophage tail gpP-like protein
MPAYNMTFEITIGGKTLKGLEKVEINRSAETVIDTAVVTLPYLIEGKNTRLDSQVKRGDAVSIKLGYDGQNVSEFEGFVKSVNPNIPLAIECEDYGFLLRRKVADRVFVGKNVKIILDDICRQCGLKLESDFDGLAFDKFVIRSATAFEVIEKIRNEYNLNIYVRNDKTLIAKGLYTEKTGEVYYDFEVNIKKSDLKFVKSEDVKIQVKIRGVGKDNKATKEIIVGESGGETVTLPERRGVTDEKTLTDIAKNRQIQLSYDGYRGSITGWLIPFVDVGYTAKINDPDNAVRDGKYYVKSVKTTFSQNGGERQVELGIKL